MANSRIKNTFYNFLTSVFGQMLAMILQFVVRTFFIKYLGKEYLGINGLFSNILQMLSLAELGVGSAIIFKLYKPLAERNKKKIVILLQFYRKVYFVIGLIITIIGLSLIPFLKYIVNDYDKIKSLGINAIFLFILYLLKVVSSYFFLAYKSAVVIADQKEYKLNVAMYFVTFMCSVLQIFVLILFSSFELYVVVLIVQVLLQNYLNARIAKKLYPFIDDKYDEKIDKRDRKEIFKDCTALLIYKINGVILKATDNIIISIFMGLAAVGMYANYYLIYTGINLAFGKVFESTKHSLGNLHTLQNYQHEYDVFKTLNFIAVVLGATAGIGIACVSNEFINSWIGKQWLFSDFFAITLGFEIYTLAMDEFLSKCRSAMGLFQQAKYRPIFGSIINLIVSVLLVKTLGVVGVLIGTIVANWTTLLWYDPYIIHKYGLKNKFSINRYYLKNLLNTLVAIILGIGLYYICSNYYINRGWLSVIVHSVIICIVVPIVYVIIYYKSAELNEFRNMLDRLLKRIKKN